MKKIIFAIIIILISGLLIFNRLEKQVQNSEKPGVIITNENGQKINVTTEIADTPKKHQQGLSNHQPLQENQGMLFVFNEKQIQSFWMKNMLFPLDIIWIEDNRIAKINANLAPEGETPQNIYKSDIPVNYVLEVPAGFCQKNNIKIGDKVFYNY